MPRQQGDETCSNCGGHGALGPYECWRCAGHGVLAAEHPLELEYPPGIRDGYTVQIPLDRYGIRNLHLTVFLRVSGRD